MYSQAAGPSGLGFWDHRRLSSSGPTVGGRGAEGGGHPRHHRQFALAPRRGHRWGFPPSVLSSLSSVCCTSVCRLARNMIISKDLFLLGDQDYLRLPKDEKRAMARPTTTKNLRSVPHLCLHPH
ncbi:unnamed protein product [Nezara viridula]|uniref:Uncharacterized protein n=1 Tax=Nezara viridula TaxID=85310 RepID=A0A9P0HPX8_NEZVI|nr:unnamed protein product [Nezara viridula]